MSYRIRLCPSGPHGNRPRPKHPELADCERAIARDVGPWFRSGFRQTGDQVDCLCGRSFVHVCSEADGCRWDLTTGEALPSTIRGDLKAVALGTLLGLLLAALVVLYGWVTTEVPAL